ncbi:cytochrome P450 [Lactifluus volemus]|nr:cytochrome P450 [Lactifluus volemus]
MEFSIVTVVDCIMVSFAVYIFFSLQNYRRRTGYPYPPGPRPWPIIGNMLDIPSRLPGIAYADMSKQYGISHIPMALSGQLLRGFSGDVMSLQLLGQVVVILSSSSAIKDLLERRGEVYSDRPVFRLHQVIGTDWLLPALRKGEAWRGGRKLLDRSLRPGAPTAYRAMMEEKARGLLGQLLLNPRDFRDHVGLFEGRVIMSLTYGYDVKTNDDEMLEAPVEVNKILAQIVLPGAVLMNHLPFLQYIHSWIPFYSYENMARRSKELCRRMRDEPMSFVQKTMREGTAIRSLASEHLQEIESLIGPERQKQETVIQETLGSLFDAGADTTVSALVSVFLALTLYPDVKKRAQAELDSVVGRDRLPTFDDRTRLPYVDAFCKEVLRWHMVLPLGFPHATTEDSIYRGFFIPKGSTILANAWAVLHDPELYPDPETFNPGRFLDTPPPTSESESGLLLHDDGRRRRPPPINDPSLIPLAFGAGKRICPGRHFADATLFILVSSVLAVFDVSNPKGSTSEKDRGSHLEGSVEDGMIQ